MGRASGETPSPAPALPTKECGAALPSNEPREQLLSKTYLLFFVLFLPKYRIFVQPLYLPSSHNEGPKDLFPFSIHLLQYRSRSFIQIRQPRPHPTPTHRPATGSIRAFPNNQPLVSPSIPRRSIGVLCFSDPWHLVSSSLSVLYPKPAELRLLNWKYHGTAPRDD
jgi:hypothetical protein